MDASQDDRKPDDWDPQNRVIANQPETFAYFNDCDQIVIRQRNWPDDDATIIVSLEFLPVLVENLCEWAGEAYALAAIDRLNALVGRYRENGGFAEEPARPSDPTGAERQRRHRERKRAGQGGLPFAVDNREAAE